MINFLGIRGLIAVGLAIALGLAWWRIEWLENKVEGLDTLVDNIVDVTRTASDNPDLKRKHVVGQIRALGSAHRQIKIELEQQNITLEEMAREAQRAKARSVEWKRIAEKARLQRDAALRELSEIALSPAEQENCEATLAEANRVLEMVHGAIQ